MKFCIVIPCYNHEETLASAVASLPAGVDAVVVDDGSDTPVRAVGGAEVLRLEKNSGKAAALGAGFARARSLGATHVVSMDSDGQHPAEYLGKIMDAARENPENIVVAVRDFDNPAVPAGRRFLNRFSNFWFRAETGKTLGDTQCGFRCYPLDVLERLDLRLEGFVFEVELLVKAAWAGTDFCQVPIPAVYTAQTLAKSHYKPFADTLKFSAMNTRLFFESVFLPKSALKKIALKK